jgi:hypothetical protein
LWQGSTQFQQIQKYWDLSPFRHTLSATRISTESVHQNREAPNENRADRVSPAAVPNLTTKAHLIGHNGSDPNDWFLRSSFVRRSRSPRIGSRHLSLHEFKVPNLDHPLAAAAIANGGTRFSRQIMPFNAPNATHCGNANVLTRTADEQTFLAAPIGR